jgi:hypothetical protein
MTFMNNGARTLTSRRDASVSFQKVTHPRAATGWFRVGLESFFVIALFLILAAVALYLRARLGFVH